MKPFNAAQSEWWRQVRTRGRKHFIIRIGVIRWGGLMFLAMVAWALLSSVRDRFSITFDVVLNALIWPFAGYWFGVLMWNVNEKRFAQEKRE